MTGFFDELTAQPDETANAAEAEGATSTQGESGAVEELPEAGQDAQRTDVRIRDTAKELLKFGLLEADQKPNLYRTATVAQHALNQVLEPLDLTAQIDEVRGLVFLTVRPESVEQIADDDWAHPLVRRQRLTLEQSLLVAILRQHYIAHEQEAGHGAPPPLVAADEVMAQLQLYLGDSGSEQKDRNRAHKLLDQLKGHGLVSALDEHERVSIRPIITHLANPENLNALLAALKARAAVDPEEHA